MRPGWGAAELDKLSERGLTGNGHPVHVIDEVDEAEDEDGADLAFGHSGRRFPAGRTGRARGRDSLLGIQLRMRAGHRAGPTDALELRRPR